MRRAVLLCLLTATAACGPTNTPSPAAPTTTMPSKPPVQASPADPKLARLTFGFCLAADKVFKLESPLLEPGVSDARVAANLRESLVVATRQAETFAHAGYRELAGRMRDWAASFDAVRARVAHGESPVTAIQSAVRKLGAIERTIDCEGDA